MPLINDLTVITVPNTGDYIIVNPTSGDTSRMTIRHLASYLTPSSVAYTNVQQSWTKAQTSTPYTLVTASSIVPQMGSGNIFDLYLSGSVTLNQPTGVVDGTCYIFRIWNSGSIVWTSGNYDFGNEIYPTLTNQSGRHDILTFLGKSGNRLDFCGIKKGFQ